MEAPDGKSVETGKVSRRATFVYMGLQNNHIGNQITIHKDIMRTKLSIVFKRVGTLFGKICGYLPRGIKRVLVRTIGFCIEKTEGRFSSFVYIIGYDMIKRMYFADNLAEIFTKTVFGDIQIRLDVTKKTQRILYLQKIYEPYVLNYLLRDLKRGDVFIDIGANVGIYTLLAAKMVEEEGTVIAFEPEKSNYEMLVENIHLNNFTFVTAERKAISNENSTATLHLNPLNDGGGSLTDLASYPDDEEVWTETQINKHFPNVILDQITEVVTLDSFLSSHGYNFEKERHVIIKIDVEGGEFNVLDGMRGLLSAGNAPDVICEVGRDGDKIMDILSMYSYKLYTLDKNGETHPYLELSLIKAKALLFSKRSV